MSERDKGSREDFSHLWKLPNFKYILTELWEFKIEKKKWFLLSSLTQRFLAFSGKQREHLSPPAPTVPRTTLLTLRSHNFPTKTAQWVRKENPAHLSSARTPWTENEIHSCECCEVEDFLINPWPNASIHGSWEQLNRAQIPKHSPMRWEDSGQEKPSHPRAAELPSRARPHLYSPAVAFSRIPPPPRLLWSSSHREYKQYAGKAEQGKRSQETPVLPTGPRHPDHESRRPLTQPRLPLQEHAMGPQSSGGLSHLPGASVTRLWLPLLVSKIWIFFAIFRQGMKITQFIS